MIKLASRQGDILTAIELIENAIDASGYNTEVQDKLFEALEILENYGY